MVVVYFGGRLEWVDIICWIEYELEEVFVVLMVLFWVFWNSVFLLE